MRRFIGATKSHLRRTLLLLGALLPGGQAAGAQNLQNLTDMDVYRIIAQGVQEAGARNNPATIAVTDRVGNVLAVYQMPGAPPTVTVSSGRNVHTGIDGLAGLVPSTLAAIAKAVTGAYLSSSGNAFSTRTASQIVQRNFNPGEALGPGGPLFGVQFSQLPCSDLSRRFVNGASPPPPDQFRGPKRSPLGLSADPGGLPLYKNGAVVGGVGVMADGVYGLDADVSNIDADADEIIAIAASTGYAPPAEIVAGRITVDGKTLRFTDATQASVVTNPGLSPPVAPSGFVAVRGYTDGGILAGQTYGTSGSGIRPVDAARDGAGYATVAATAGFVPLLLASGPDAPLFPIVAGAVNEGQNISAGEAPVILGQALRVAASARAQIRRPLQSPTNVTISIVDAEGQVLGQARSADGPLFGVDVSLQKARTTAFMSKRNAAANLENPGVFPAIRLVSNTLNRLVPEHAYDVPNYAANMRAFIGNGSLSDGTAFTARAIGNLARPYYPDGVNANGNGPLSRPVASWSPFSTGLQFDLVVSNIINHVLFVRNLNLDITGDGLGDFDPDGDGAVNDTGFGCTPVRSGSSGLNPLANGLQIFAGSSPIYKNGVLVGGIGVSGDGIDQDDMIAFLGLHNAGIGLGTGISHAPAAIRADQIVAAGVRLRYVSCPYSPFLNSREQRACEGK
ncbi:MAG: hypothetical protein EXR08_04580 [Alphaproteobacteria bacterium]|nr:hypothetical protein [Alphaproteobacteria bacterium]